MDGLQPGLGLATGRLPKGWYQAVPSFFALVCGQRVSAITTAKQNSNVSAVRFDHHRIERQNSKAEGSYYLDSVVYPQWKPR